MTCVVTPVSLGSGGLGHCRLASLGGGEDAADPYEHCLSLSLALCSSRSAPVRDEKWHGRGRRFDPDRVYYIFNHLQYPNRASPTILSQKLACKGCLASNTNCRILRGSLPDISLSEKRVRRSRCLYLACRSRLQSEDYSRKA